MYLISPLDGATVSSPLTVRFGLSGMGVAPAGVVHPKAGHHHLIIDAATPVAGAAISNDEHHRHFGGGQTEVEIELDHRAFAYWDPADPGYADRNHRVPVAAGGGHVGHRQVPGWYADPGDYEVRLGASSADIRAVMALTLEG